MPASAGLRFRAACPGDAHAIAGLHADSWQRHYRGAYSDAFLDNDAAGYLLPLWTGRLASPDPQARTILAEHDGEVVGLAHTILGQDATWGAFLDNLHVAHGLKRQGIGARAGLPGGGWGPARTGREPAGLVVLGTDLSGRTGTSSQRPVRQRRPRCRGQAVRVPRRTGSDRPWAWASTGGCCTGAPPTREEGCRRR